jgi:hypothetical protein
VLSVRQVSTHCGHSVHIAAQLIQELIADGLLEVTRYAPDGDRIMRLFAQTATIENGFVYRMLSPAGERGRGIACAMVFVAGAVSHAVRRSGWRCELIGRCSDAREVSA